MKIIVLTIIYILICKISIGQTPSRIESIECNSSFIIRKFQDKSKAGNIVIDKEIEYHATPSIGSNWIWEVGSEANGIFTPKWSLAAITPTVLGGLGEGKLNSTALPSLNSELGSTFSIVQASKTVTSTEIAKSNDPGSLIPNGVRVFFKKNQINPHSGYPNWFHYWKQEIPNSLLEMPGIKLYNVNTCSYNTNPTKFNLQIEYISGAPFVLGAPNTVYGYTQTDIPSIATSLLSLSQGGVCPASAGLGTVVTGYHPSLLKIHIGDGCGYQKSDPSWPFIPSKIIEGIHVFLLTVVHETTHVRIGCELWADGYSSSADLDEDRYPDDWELMVADPKYGFKVPQNDAFSTNFPQHLPLGWQLGTAGTWYEEATCKEAEKSFNRNLLDSKDWSFDTSYQGKQW